MKCFAHESSDFVTAAFMYVQQARTVPLPECWRAAGLSLPAIGYMHYMRNTHDSTFT